MAAYIIRRLGYSLISLFLLSVTIFLVIHATGDPARLIIGPGGRAEDYEQARKEWGLDKSLPEQYVSFVVNMARGDLGNSFQYRMPVRNLYFERLPSSLQLAAVAFMVSLLIGIPLGIITAVKIDTGWDTLSKVIALLGLSIPNFFIGLVLIIVFAVGLRLLPAAGSGTWQHLVMPGFALGWYFAASMLRLTRSSMLEVLGSEYIKLARLKGVPEKFVIVKHAFKNALIPVMTLAGIMIVGVNLIVDLLYALIDPRIRYA